MEKSLYFLSGCADTVNMTTTQGYTVRNEAGLFMLDGTNRRTVETAARAGVRRLGGCWFVVAAGEIVTVVECVNNKVECRHLDQPETQEGATE